jgi:hypothetical protein
MPRSSKNRIGTRCFLNHCCACDSLVEQKLRLDGAEIVFPQHPPRAVVPPMHLSTRHGWPDVHVVAVSCITVSQSGDPKSEPPDVWRCYGASVAPVLPAAAEMFLGAWQHGIVGEYPVNLYL